MSTATTETAGSVTERPALHLVRWTVTSGSNVQSRGAVVIASGDHQWEGSAEGNGPVAALYRAVDVALVDVLAGHPRLIAYDVHAVTESPDSEALVTVKIAPPETASGERATGRYRAEARNENIIAASVEAYIEALNELLRDESWAGATDAAGNRRRAETAAAAARRAARKAKLDEDLAEPDPTAWFER